MLRIDGLRLGTGWLHLKSNGIALIGSRLKTEVRIERIRPRKVKSNFHLLSACENRRMLLFRRERCPVDVFRSWDSMMSRKEILK